MPHTLYPGIVATHKISLRTTILDKHFKKEGLYLLDETNNTVTSANDHAHDELSGGYGSLQPRVQNDYDHGYGKSASSNECESSYMKAKQYVRSFSTKEFDQDVDFRSRGAISSNLANYGSHNLSYFGSRSDVSASCSLLQYSQRSLPKRFEVPPIYFLGQNGSSARESVGFTISEQQQLTAVRNVKFQTDESYSRTPATSSGDLATHKYYHLEGNCGKQPLNLTEDESNMSNFRNASYTNASIYDGDSPAIQFDEGNDLFVNFNATLERLPTMQRELGCRLRRHLQFFFMDPLQKYQIRRQFPFKLFIQILKVVFITVQLILFAELRISHVDFLDDSATVMRHRFLKNWNNDRDEVVYPPDSGKYSVFSSDEIIEHFSYIVKSVCFSTVLKMLVEKFYYTIQNDSFASFSYDTTFAHQMQRDSLTEPLGSLISDFARIPPIRFCRDRIADVTVQNDTYIFDVSPVKECFSLNFTHSEVRAIIGDVRKIRGVLARRNISFTAEDALSMSKSTLSFNLRTIHFSPLSTDQKPECYLIKITIEFDNSRHTGQVFVRLNSIISYVNLCNGRVLQVFAIGLDTIAIGIIDIFVLLMCLFSLLLCSRALIKAQLLKKTTCEYFSMVFSRRLSVSDKLEFFNLWYVMILINDILIVLGTVCKVTIEFRDFDSDLFTLTGILLGLGALLVYIGLLRYLGFFSQYNILVLTLKRSLPSILRFMVCTIILYAGFLIAGWVIIGPYSIKFRTLSQSSEALFSLLNGDDMFATFYTISDSSTTIKVVGTIYIYFFVSLFIYIVLSLFIAIIMDSYEVVKERYNQTNKVERSTLYEFLASAEPLGESSPEARELFSAERLLQLDDSWLLQNWSGIRRSLRDFYRNLRTGQADGNTDLDNNADTSGNFHYHAFENSAHDSSRESVTDGDHDDVASVEQQRRRIGVTNNRDNHQRRTLGSSNSLLSELSSGIQQETEEAINGSIAHYQVSPHGNDTGQQQKPPKTSRLPDNEESTIRLDGFKSSSPS